MAVIGYIFGVVVAQSSAFRNRNREHVQPSPLDKKKERLSERAHYVRYCFLGRDWGVPLLFERKGGT